MERRSWAEDRPGGQFGGSLRGWLLPATVVATTPPLAILFWLVATRFDGSVAGFIDAVDGASLRA